MAKYHGHVGYAIDEEVLPGVWKEQITEYEYYGDIVKNRASVNQNSTTSGRVIINNSISIIADPFAYENFYAIRYVTYLGKKWNVSMIDIERPRLLLTLGGLYNEQT